MTRSTPAQPANTSNTSNTFSQLDTAGMFDFGNLTQFFGTYTGVRVTDNLGILSASAKFSLHFHSIVTLGFSGFITALEAGLAVKHAVTNKREKDKIGKSGKDKGVVIAKAGTRNNKFIGRAFFPVLTAVCVNLAAAFLIYMNVTQMLVLAPAAIALGATLGAIAPYLFIVGFGAGLLFNLYNTAKYLKNSRQEGISPERRAANIRKARIAIFFTAMLTVLVVGSVLAFALHAAPIVAIVGGALGTLGSLVGLGFFIHAKIKAKRAQQKVDQLMAPEKQSAVEVAAVFAPVPPGSLLDVTPDGETPGNVDDLARKGGANLQLEFAGVESSAQDYSTLPPAPATAPAMAAPPRVSSPLVSDSTTKMRATMMNAGTQQSAAYPAEAFESSGNTDTSSIPPIPRGALPIASLAGHPSAQFQPAPTVSEQAKQIDEGMKSWFQEMDKSQP